jgi:hypothetical protein
MLLYRVAVVKWTNESYKMSEWTSLMPFRVADAAERVSVMSMGPHI